MPTTEQTTLPLRPLAAMPDTPITDCASAGGSQIEAGHPLNGGIGCAAVVAALLFAGPLKPIN